MLITAAAAAKAQRKGLKRLATLKKQKSKIQLQQKTEQAGY
jgi:hypothetical protein